MLLSYGVSCMPCLLASCTLLLCAGLFQGHLYTAHGILPGVMNSSLYRSCAQSLPLWNLLANRSWNDAQQYCREKYTDLATIESMDDISRLNSSFSYNWAWIGLQDDPESWKNTLGNDTNSWRWAITGETSKIDYHNWDSTQPDYYLAKETCVIMGELPTLEPRSPKWNKKLHTQECNHIPDGETS
uniref:C-type lectin domain-containing protein n=1 Tax=Maylandia zebra TaxID=106582 RepID=A0A3P9CCC5_9CICH